MTYLGKWCSSSPLILKLILTVSYRTLKYESNMILPFYSVPLAICLLFQTVKSSLSWHPHGSPEGCVLCNILLDFLCRNLLTPENIWNNIITSIQLPKICDYTALLNFTHHHSYIWLFIKCCQWAN